MKHQNKEFVITPDLELQIELLEQKYESLVWFARKTSKDIEIPGVAKAMQSIAEEHTDEVLSLINQDFGSWQHGFNSGMLAALRFIQTSIYEDLGQAYKGFPNLGT